MLYNIRLNHEEKWLNVIRVPDPQNVGDPQNAGLGSGTSRQQNSHVEVNVLLSA